MEQQQIREALVSRTTAVIELANYNNHILLYKYFATITPRFAGRNYSVTDKIVYNFDENYEIAKNYSYTQDSNGNYTIIKN